MGIEIEGSITQLAVIEKQQQCLESIIPVDYRDDGLFNGEAVVRAFQEVRKKTNSL